MTTKQTTKAAAPAKASPPAPAAKPKAAPERPDGLRAGSKMAAAIDMLTRKKGATCPEIAEALGWSVLNSSTLRGYAKRAGIKVREDDSEKPTRFFGTPKGKSQ